MASKARIQSDSIKVFPCANRTGENVTYSRLTTEANIVSLINKLISRDGFVISDSFDVSSDTGIFEFNIHGYYFQVKAYELYNLITSVLGSPSTVYANIFIDTSRKNFPELKGQDQQEGQESFFTGVEFTPDAPAETIVPNEKVYSLKILNQNAFDYVIPKESRILFTADKLAVDVSGDIDGGDLDA